MKFLVATPLVLASLLAVACAGPYGTYGSSGSSIDDTGSSDISTEPRHWNSMDKALKRSSSTSSLGDYKRNSGFDEKTGGTTFGRYEPASTRRTRSFSTNLGTQGSSSHLYSPNSDPGSYVSPSYY
ncbi:hypothetical protein BJ085DRAFT_27170 [Dimargaris cristalligena]|uniref:Uncharacterized protein n=1 Tax=Dimargaris cristalligena TaxID=215637 RepID=A0A4P9ZRK2_9FUNG|nr:hypothetical protein BJ085DRAFT_27170 [Dimargaris cristalligena]|eukprot:RKP35282.1 hypothetical protein BJ085DRAFT_27170 [Dimargaris cristalligena]